MLKIGDFSHISEVSVRMLRHYDKLGLIEPARVDPLTGYRYYSIEQLPRLNRLVALKELGFSLEQISRLLDEDVDADRLRSMLVAKQAEIERNLQEEQARLVRVEARLGQIEREDEPYRYEAKLKNTQPRTIVSTRDVAPTLGDVPAYRRALFEEVYRFLARHRVKPPNTPGAELVINHNGGYAEEDIDMETAVMMDSQAVAGMASDPPVSIRVLPATSTMASAIHHGSLFGVRGAFCELFKWIGVNGYSSIGACREVHLFGREIDLAGADSLFTNPLVVEIQVPIKDP